MELWDLLDKNRTPLGITHPRGRQYPMPMGTYHTVVTVFTVDNRGRLLITLRAPTKNMFPGYWEVTGGSGVAGEDSLASALRELSEETGITVAPDRVELLGAIREPSAFMDCYLVCMDVPGEEVDLILQDGETVDARWVSFFEFDTMIHEGLIPPAVAMRYGVMREKLIERFGQRAWDEAAEEKDHEP